MPRHGIGQQIQRTSSGSTPHDRITILQICPSRSLPFHRPRQSTLRYPAVDPNRSSTRSAQRHLPLIRESLPLRPTRWIGSIPITHRIRGYQIPIVNAAPPTSLSRGFLPGRFADAGPRVRGATIMGAGIRKPSPTRTSARARTPRFPSPAIRYWNSYFVNTSRIKERNRQSNDSSIYPRTHCPESKRAISRDDNPV